MRKVILFAQTDLNRDSFMPMQLKIPENFAIWKDEYALGVEAVDREHEHLFAILRDCYERHQQGGNREDVIVLLDSLRRYALTHFHNEEAYMARIGYPNLPMHAGTHAALLNSVEVMMGVAVQQSGSVDMNRILLFMRDWLVDHVLSEDVKLKEYARA